jgi:hypothetical protein
MAAAGSGDRWPAGRVCGGRRCGGGLRVGRVRGDLVCGGAATAEWLPAIIPQAQGRPDMA